MRFYDIIKKKRDGLKLTEAEIKYFVHEYAEGNIPDYQMSALCMAIYFKGMDDEETAILTSEMANSGDTLSLEMFGNLSADKHSTGGVGDKTTLIVAPIVACAGVKVAKMSGRGLEHTGGTVDKLESIPNFKTTLSIKEFLGQVEKIGIAVIGQTKDLAPADKKLYALRDVTATVECPSLIVSSIMSKKLAAGSKSIVLDVKVGSGAFNKTRKDGYSLAEKMVAIGNKCGRNTVAVITNMDLPLGNCVGNSLEVKEAIEMLKCKGDKDLKEISLILASYMISLALNLDISLAKKRAEDILISGKALAKFKEWIKAQGGDPNITENYSIFKEPEFSFDVISKKSGYIVKSNAETIGTASLILGAGRKKKEDIIDPSAGIIIKKKTGDFVNKGDILATLFTDKSEKLCEAEEKYLSALTFDEEKPNSLPLILGVVDR